MVNMGLSSLDFHTHEALDPSSAARIQHLVTVSPWSTLLFCLALILVWGICDILTAHWLPQWRRSPPELPFKLPLLGHALYFSVNMRQFSYYLV